MRIQVKEERCSTEGLSEKEAVLGSNDPVKIFVDVSYFLCIIPFRLTMKRRIILGFKVVATTGMN